MAPALRCRVISILMAALLGAMSPAALPAAGPAGGAATAGIKTLEPGKLKICLYAGFAPFASKDEKGRWQGWDVDYLEAFAKANGLQMVVVEKDFSGIWLWPGKDACDIAGTGISDTAERRAAAGKDAVWSNTYYGVVRTFLVRTEKFDKLAKIGDLQGTTVIVTKGSTAHSDVCYRLAASHLHPCARPGGEKPCDFKGLELPATARAQDPRCVNIEYPRDNLEEKAAEDVAKSADFSVFAYGGGYGSIQGLVCAWGASQALATVWPHCNMSSDLQHAYAEPFSFVVRAADTGLAHALNCYVNSSKYAGTPIPELGCARPPWTPDPDVACPR